MSDEDATRVGAIATYFFEKIEKIIATIAVRLNGTQPDPIRNDDPFDGARLLELSPVTEAEVRKLLLSMPVKSSSTDFISTTLLKECSNVFAAIIARLANLNFS